ncbi:hypothetical protein T02_982 [Trichinella nativa]|uniref:Uncharacterized protein n=1 Tax=Trichinella nativa TaxID=6335 RepID=A0A0V1KPM6_9BILA|nr:hypothetical protein T02_982 [Trichinella nativa]
MIRYKCETLVCQAIVSGLYGFVNKGVRWSLEHRLGLGFSLLGFDPASLALCFYRALLLFCGSALRGSVYTASGPAAQRSTALIAIWRLRHDGCSSRSIANWCRIVYKRSHCSANNGWYWARRGPFLTLIRVAKRRGGDLPGRARALFLPCPCVVSTSSWVCHTNVVGARLSGTSPPEKENYCYEKIKSKFIKKSIELAYIHHAVVVIGGGVA